MPVEWNPHSASMIQFNNGNNGGIISLPRVFKSLIDTPEFQRLRHIKQLGNALLVFPDADHSRFIHSLGTASLAFQFMLELSKRSYDGEYLINGNDILAVTLAAACHDLGHGPFSHMYEEIFSSNVHERHEALSIKMFNKIFEDHDNVKNEFCEYFDEKYFELVKQLIDPPDYCNPDGAWPLVVSKKKAFLFGIVSNSLNGLDVDKFDYLIRDAARSGIPVSINKNVVDLLFKTAQIVEHPNYGFSWIAFPLKFSDSILHIFEARKSLHEQLYNHRVLIILDELLKKALQAAGDDLEILGTNNNPVKLKDCTSDLHAFLKLNDSVVDLINNSLPSEPRMIEARRLLEQISARKFPRAIAKLDYLKPQKREFEDEVKRALNEDGVDCSEITIVMKVFHFGKGFHNPIGDVLFYETKNSVELVKHSTDTSCSRTCLFVYGPVGCSDEFASKIHKHLSIFAADKGFEIPTKLFP